MRQCLQGMVGMAQSWLPAVDRTSQHSITDWGKAHEAPFQIEELQEVNGCRGVEHQFSLSSSPLTK